MFRSTNLFNPSALISLKLGTGQIYVGGNIHTNKDFNIADYNGFDVFMGINLTIGKSKYCKKYFIDTKNGEWYGYLHYDNTPSTTLKGNIFKGPFHIPRLYMIMAILDEFASIEAYTK